MNEQKHVTLNAGVFTTEAATLHCFCSSSPFWLSSGREQDLCKDAAMIFPISPATDDLSSFYSCKKLVWLKIISDFLVDNF